MGRYTAVLALHLGTTRRNIYAEKLMLFAEGIFDADYRVAGEELLYRRRDCEERIIPWGLNAGAWRRFAGEAPISFCPEIDIRLMEQVAATSLTGRIWPRHKNRILACRFVLNSWPLYARDQVRRFPYAHWPLLMFMNSAGDAATDLLQTNPALGFLVAERINGEGANTKALAALAQKRRHLAGEFGFDRSEAAVKLLQKIPPESVSDSFLQSVSTALKDDASKQILAHAPSITPAVLKVATRPELRGRVTAAVLAKLGRFRSDTPQFDIVARLDALAEEARRRNVAVPLVSELKDIDAGFRAPPPNQPVPAPARQSGRFPNPPVPETDKIRAIRSGKELRREGEVMRHCIGTNRYYAREILRGDLYAYRVLSPERLTLAIRKIRGQWHVGELKGYQNGAPSASSWNDVEHWLQGTGPAADKGCPETSEPGSSERAVPVQLAFDF